MPKSIAVSAVSGITIGGHYDWNRTNVNGLRRWAVRGGLLRDTSIRFVIVLRLPCVCRAIAGSGQRLHEDAWAPLPAVAASTLSPQGDVSRRNSVFDELETFYTSHTYRERLIQIASRLAKNPGYPEVWGRADELGVN